MNAKDVDGNTPLSLAVMNGHERSVQDCMLQIVLSHHLYEELCFLFRFFLLISCYFEFLKSFFLFLVD